MIFYSLDHSNEKTFNSQETLEQKFLREFTGKEFSPPEAATLWRSVLEHKWHVSERLKRDIGLRVAAIDFVENFYEPTVKEVQRSSFKGILPRFFKALSNSVPPPPVSSYNASA